MNSDNNDKEIFTGDILEILHSKKIMISYAFGNFMWEFIEGVIVILVFSSMKLKLGCLAHLLL